MLDTTSHIAIAQLRALYIPTEERDEALTQQLSRLMKSDAQGNLLPEPVRFTADLETRGIMLIEPPGGGKTTAVSKVIARIPALNPKDGNNPRYLHVQVPSPATLKSLGTEILKQTGFVGVAKTATAWEIFQAVRTRFSNLGIVVLWIDEAQDLFLSRTAREIDDTLKMLKSLMLGPSAVIPILSGTERLAQAMSYDPQVARRFTKIMPRDLTPGPDSGNVVDLVARYAGKADLKVSLPADLPERLIRGSRGRFGRLVETTINAIEWALQDGDDTLELRHFAEAWGMQEGCSWDQNVFVSPTWASLVLDAEAEEFDAARTKRQQKQLEKA